VDIGIFPMRLEIESIYLENLNWKPSACLLWDCGYSSAADYFLVKLYTLTLAPYARCMRVMSCVQFKVLGYGRTN
jgi:hypothetical protein